MDWVVLLFTPSYWLLGRKSCAENGRDKLRLEVLINSASVKLYSFRRRLLRYLCGNQDLPNIVKRNLIGSTGVSWDVKRARTPNDD
jgi:hypothetical protein